MNTSKYFLQNEFGARINLTPGDAPYWLRGVQGLGVDGDDEFADIDEGFFTLSDEVWPQITIVSDLVFMSEAYENYRTFVNWLMQARSLVFVYVPIGTEEYMREVKLSRLTKPPRRSGTLVCDIAFEPLTPWYRPVPLTFEKTIGVDEDLMRYPFMYGDAKYSSSYIGGGEVYIPAAGHVPASMKVQFTGALSNPEITLTTESGRQVGKCSAGISVDAGDSIEYSSSYRDSHLTVVRNGVEENAIGEVDIITNPFFHVPVDENCILTITSDIAISGDMAVTVYYYYRSI